MCDTKDIKQTTKKCKSCYATLNNENANKCHSCQTYQNWKSYLGFGTTLMALFTALISVVSLSWNKIEPYISAQHLSVKAIGVNSSQVTLVAMNNTLNTAWLEKATLRLSYSVDSTEDERYEIEFDNNQRLAKSREPTFLSVKMAIIDRLFESLFLDYDTEEVTHELREFFDDIFINPEESVLNNTACYIDLRYTSGDKYIQNITINLTDSLVKLTEARSISIVSDIAKLVKEKPDELGFDEDEISRVINNMCIHFIVETQLRAIKNIVNREAS